MKVAKWIESKGVKTIKLICPVCGETYLKSYSEYKRNLKKNRRNFCSLRCSCIQGNIENPPTNVPDSFKKYWGTNIDECTPFRYYLRMAKQRKKHEFNIDCEHLINIWTKQEGKCAITGLDIELKTMTTTSLDLGLTSASLDRIDNSKGYIKGNVQFLCVGINHMKGARTDKEVIEFIEKIVNIKNTI